MDVNTFKQQQNECAQESADEAVAELKEQLEKAEQARAALGGQ